MFRKIMPLVAAIGLFANGVNSEWQDIPDGETLKPGTLVRWKAGSRQPAGTRRGQVKMVRHGGPPDEPNNQIHWDSDTPYREDITFESNDKLQRYKEEDTSSGCWF